MPFFSVPNQSIRWLLAELSVVVLGILIAFQVDSWREESSRRSDEYLFLSDMIIDLENDTRSLERGIAQRQDRLPAIRKLIVMLSNPQTSQLDEKVIIELEYQALDGAVSSFQPNIVTFDKVQQSGELAIVRDSELYQKIVEYYSFRGINPDMNGVAAWLAPWRQLSLELYGPLNFVQTYDQDTVSGKYRLEEEEPDERTINIQTRKENNEYMSFLGDMFQSQSYHERRWQQILERSRELQESIKNYLD
jgi:hypothetical protein